MTQEGAVPPTYYDAVRRMVREEIAAAFRSGASRNMSISAGGRLTVKGGNLVVENASGGLAFYVGAVSPSLPDGTYQPGFILYREDGTVAAGLYDPDPAGDYKQFFAVYDRSGNVVVSDDTDSGQGLGRPYLPLPLYAARFTADPQACTSGTWETLWQGSVYKQHPRMLVQASVGADVGSAGEVRVMVGGVQLGATAPVTSTPAGVNFGPAAVAGAYSSSLTVQLQAQRTSGAGVVRVQAAGAWGLQS